MECAELRVGGCNLICQAGGNIYRLAMQHLNFARLVVVCPKVQYMVRFYFSIFINDFLQYSNFSSFTLLANDSTLTCKFKNTPLQQISTTIANQLTDTYDKTNKNMIKINPAKKDLMTFSYRKVIRSLNLFKL